MVLSRLIFGGVYKPGRHRQNNAILNPMIRQNNRARIIYCIFALAFCLYGCSQSSGGSSGYTFIQVSFSNADYDPTFSPDGNYIIYDRKYDNNLHELFKVNVADTTEVVSLGYGAEASWNPADASQIAYNNMISNESGGVTTYASGGIYIMNINTLVSWQIAETGCAMQAWSTDGQYLIYVNGGRIMSVSAEGTGTRELTSLAEDGDCAWPSFSYDGTKIVYIKKSNPTDQGGDIWIMNSDGSSKESFYVASGSYQCLIFQRAWNRYDEIIFMQSASAEAHASPRVYLIPYGGSSATALTEDTLVSGDPVWDESGNNIALIRGPADDTTIQNVYYFRYRN
jgi:Tol biopolymer transport system component